MKTETAILCPFSAMLPGKMHCQATLELMVQNPRNDMDAARLGLVPIVPEGTTFDLDISAGHARVDMSAQALNAEDKQQEENMRTAIVWALTEFDTVNDVNFLIDGKARNTLTHGTNIGGSYTRVGLNAEEDSAATFADSDEIQVFFPARTADCLYRFPERYMERRRCNRCL